MIDYEGSSSASSSLSTSYSSEIKYSGEEEGEEIILCPCPAVIKKDPLEHYLAKLVEEQTELAVLEASLICANQEEEICLFNSDEHRKVLRARKFLPFYVICEFNMTRLLAISLFLWSILHLTLFYTRTNSLVREGPSPSPFFRNTNGVIQDFYRGDMMPGLLVSRAELSIVMLYAPWDSRSKQFRHSYVKVANAFKHLNMVHFVAVNCHFHRGQCRNMFKLLFFPVIFAYTSYGHPIVFNQVFSSDRLFSWVLHLLNPLRRIHSADELHSSVLSTDFLVLGHFALELPRPLPRAYHVFLHSAYKAANSRSSLAFSVVLNQSLALSELGFSGTNQIRFYTFYTDNALDQNIASLEINQQTKSQDVIDWINECIEKYSSRAVRELELEEVETVGKSEALFHQLNTSRSTLVLFTHLLGLPCHSQSEIALKNFAKLFYYCPNDSEKIDPEQYNVISQEKYILEALKLCTLQKKKLIPSKKSIMKAECPNRIITSDEENGYDKIIKFFSEGHFRRRYSSGQKNRKNVDSKYQSDVGWLQRLSCKLVRLIRTPHYGHNGELSDHSMADFEHVTMPNWPIGAGCRLNRSMGFLMMDKRFGLHFMQKWGLQEAQWDRDAVAIVDREAERIFWMKDANISKETLAEFVNGYFNNTLVWSVKDQNLGRSVITPNETNEQWFQYSILNRLNRTGFLVEILNQNRAHDAVVFFSGGGWHGSSTSVMHYFHQTQHYFSDFGDLIKFYSIDVSQNTLPWKFHFNRLPTVAFFPAKSDHDSFSFSIQDGLAFNVPNLLGFILPRCQQRLRWLLAFSACKGMCLERNRRRIGEIVRRTEEDIRTLRRMQRKRGGGNPNVGGSRHLRFLLRRRHLQKKVLSHLLGLVQSLQINVNDGDVHQLGRGIAEQAIFANWILTAKLGLHFPIA